MYTQNRLKDVGLFGKALLSNQLAWLAPGFYMRLTGETGRGHEEASAGEIAQYFMRCFDDYQEQLGMTRPQFAAFLKDKRVLEYGPGDILGVGLLMYAHGAELVHCYDRFPLHQASAKNLQVYELLLASLDPAARERAGTAFRTPGDPASGFVPTAIDYCVAPDGLSRASGQYDVVLSRAVLEHVSNLPGTIGDIAGALKPGGVSVHEVDLRSHGLDRYQPFDFLTWPELLYRLMFSHKGFPNRWRLNTYRELFRQYGLRPCKLQPTTKLAPESVALIEPHVSKTLRGTTNDELSWMGFWVVLEHAQASRAQPPS